ncbi:hypothetical protein F4861DRAFT_548084 [Xylaria intraflava]|nr:hypothetical protein F4861DRAFT_548084 [Xylaria intraflava]
MMPPANVHEEGILSAIDGTHDGDQPGMIPRYDVTHDADAVPVYTRDYLNRLSQAVEARLRVVDETHSYFPVALAKLRRLHRWQSGLLVVLAALWVATCVVVLVAIYTGRGLWAPKEG